MVLYGTDSRRSRRYYCRHCRYNTWRNRGNQRQRRIKHYLDSTTSTNAIAARHGGVQDRARQLTRIHRFAKTPSIATCSGTTVQHFRQDNDKASTTTASVLYLSRDKKRLDRLQVLGCDFSRTIWYFHRRLLQLCHHRIIVPPPITYVPDMSAREEKCVTCCIVPIATAVAI